MFSYFRFGRLKVILPSVIEFYSNVSESHCLEHVFELLLGISSCRLIIHRCQATLFHHNVSSVVHSLSVSACAKSSFVNKNALESLFPTATVTEYQSDDEAFDALRKGTAHCIVAPSSRIKTIGDRHDLKDYETV